MVEKECYEWVVLARVEEVLAAKTSLVHLRYLCLQSVLKLHQIVKFVQGLGIIIIGVGSGAETRSSL